MSLKSTVLEIVETSILSIILILIIYNFVAAIEVVSGSSMEPTFHTGERILVDKVTHKVKPLHRGEVIVIYPPGDNRHFIKRVLGTPGDVFKIVNCQVYVSQDGEKFELLEAYVLKDACTRGGPGVPEGRSTKLGKDEYVVLGDNRENSIDSRVFGVIKGRNIIGRVIFRFWPLTRLGFVK